MKVLKFGGSSVGNAGKIEKVIEIIKSTFSESQTGLVVFSAYQGVTDKLIKAGEIAAQGNDSYLKILEELQEQHINTARELLSIQRQSNVLAEIKYVLRQLEEILHGIFLIKELSPKSLDFIMSFGERLSAYTISESLKDKDFENYFLDTREIIKTDNHFGRARVNFSTTNENILSIFDNNCTVQIVTGFISSSLNDETTTLGRGGSDFTASIFGAALDVKEIEIWTDVDGVLTADPRKVPTAFSIPEMTYEEAMELSHFGAKVIYPPTMQPALDKNIPLRIKNTLNPSYQGTLISKDAHANEYLITGISSIDDIALLTIQGSGMIGVAGIAERIFNALATKKINIILITQASSEHSICLAILPQYKEAAVEALQDELKYEIRDEIVSEINVENNFSILAVVGENMRHRKGLAARVFQSLGDHGINISAIAQGSSELNISIVVAKDDEAVALNAVHNAFFGAGVKPIHLYLVGTGLIGGTLLFQINSQLESLEKNKGLSFRITGLADIDRMIFDQNGLNLNSWKEELRASNTTMDLNKFVENMKETQLPNSIFIDCTADEKITEKYSEILKSGISIVTPNKKANTRSHDYYLELHQSAKNNNCHFLYETNVGAGLPVIGSIQNLIAAGDEIYKIEGILSDTLSYIFNNFSSENSFSQTVIEAREKGYTEPDPRDDLNGMDVARKILIIAREIGYSLELDDVQVESLIPEEVRGVASVDEFLKILSKYDDAMQKKIQKTEQSAQKQRYIASFENGKANVSLVSVDKNHPFYHMQGSDNIIAIHSKYYATPLVIKGSGAGADVTAAGVFADVLKVAIK